MSTGQIYVESEWEKLKLGCISASEMDVLFTDPKLKADKEAGNLSKGAVTYLNEKVSEMLTGTMRQMEGLAALDWGSQFEPAAIELLRVEYPNMEYYGNENRKFFKYTQFSGGTPDAVDNNLVFELKCPENPANHIKNLLLKDEDSLRKVSKDYWVQIQMNMLCVGKERGIPFKDMRGVFVSYCPIMLKENLKLKKIPVQPNMEFYDQIDAVLEKAENYISEVLNQLIP